MPVAGPGELLIRVAASGINRPDVLQRKGLYPVPPAPRICRGSRSRARSSTAIAAALAAAGFTVGDRVCALVAGGGYAEFCVAPVGQCLPCPANLSDVEAASLPETFFTVWSNVFDRGRLQPGETLLVQGGSERHRRDRDPDGQGVRRDGDRHRRQRRQGGRVPRARRRPRDQLQDPGLRRRGAAPHRRQAASTSSSTWSPASYVGARGQVPGRGRPPRHHRGPGRHRRRQVDAGLVLRRRLTITGSTLRPRPVAFKAAIAAALSEDGLAVARVGPRQAGDPPGLSRRRGGRAHALMETNQHIGKLVLRVVSRGERRARSSSATGR